MSRHVAATRLGLACSILVLSAGSVAAEGGLQPFQMVRSLQLVQDRIATGDHAALPMQRKLLELIDSRMRDGSTELFEDQRNFRALLIYAMSGGNPATVEVLLPQLELEAPLDRVGQGVVNYLNGNTLAARRDFRRIDPGTQHEELVAFLSLVKGSVIATEEGSEALRLFDHARLLAPGTLVEEAALRRSVALLATLGDASRFMSASAQYVRRFLRSPYAAQFADGFVNGIAGFAAEVDTREIEEIVSWMNREQARTVYLRLARQSAIDGHPHLLAFSSARVRDLSDDEADLGDPRNELYANISSVTSDTVGEVLERLEALDPSGLSERDRHLLTAARAVAREVVAPVTGSRRQVETEEETVEPVAVRPAPTTESPDISEKTDELVASTRSRLDAIDNLLGAAEE